MFKSKTTTVALLVIAIVAGISFAFFLAQDPLRGMSNFERGEHYFNTTNDPNGHYDIEKAYYYYTQAIEQDAQQHAHLWYQAGRIDFLNGKFDNAIAKFDEQELRFKDEVEAVYYMQGLTYGYRARKNDSPEDWQKAEEYFTKYMEYNAYAAWPQVDLAWVYFAQGKYEIMLDLLEKTVELHPENAWVLNMYGLALLNTGELEEAKTNFELARDTAVTLEIDDWGKVYPGNNPQLWGIGLNEFLRKIEKNIEITKNQIREQQSNR